MLMKVTNADSVLVFDPRGKVEASDTPVARRPVSLDGLRFAILDNSKWNANKILRGSAAELQKAIEMDPNNTVTQHYIGYLLLKMNRPADAVAHVSRAMDLGGAFNAGQLADLQRTFENEGASAFFHKQAEYAQQLNERGTYR